MTVNNLASLHELCDRILSLEQFLIVSHYNPDTDAYGSSLGLGLGLRALGKGVSFINESGVLPRYRFLPSIAEVRTVLPAQKYDGVIACDCGDEKRMGDTLKEQLKKHSLLINIDHHRSNNNFGTHNWVEAEASSASEMVFMLLEEMARRTQRSPFTREVATCLLAGIIGDTGSFRYSTTGEGTFSVAAKLVAYGAEPSSIGEALYGTRRLSAVRLQAHALCSLEISHDGRLAQVVLSAQTMATYAATSDDTEDLVERMRDIEGVEVAIFLREEDGYWKVSMRTKKVGHDLSLMAQAFGGGGHQAASGFRWRGGLSDLRIKLALEVDKLLLPRG